MRPLLAVLAIALGLAGCGEPASEEDQVKSALVGFSHALADGDGEKACGLMTDEFKALFATNNGSDAKDCAAAVDATATALPKASKDALHEIKVDSVTVTGDTAKAKVSPSQSTNATQSLRKVGGKWLVDTN